MSDGEDVENSGSSEVLLASEFNSICEFLYAASGDENAEIRIHLRRSGPLSWDIGYVAACSIGPLGGRGAMYTAARKPNDTLTRLLGRLGGHIVGELKRAADRFEELRRSVL